MCNNDLKTDESNYGLAKWYKKCKYHTSTDVVLKIEHVKYSITKKIWLAAINTVRI